MDPKASRRLSSIVIGAVVLALFWRATSWSDDQRFDRLVEGVCKRGAQVRPPSEEQIREALLSVEFWTTTTGAQLLDFPPALRPIPIERAAEILKADAAQGPFGGSRCRRSVIKLAVAGLSFDASGDPKHAHRGALEILGVPIAELDLEIQKIKEDLPTLPPTSIDPKELRLLVLKRLEPLLQKKLTFALFLPGCTPIGKPKTTVTMEWTDNQGSQSSPCSLLAPVTAEVLATTQVLVERKFDELSKLMDAQNWDAETSPPDQCNVYFESTYVVDKTEEEGWQRRICPAPPKPGTEYDWTPLQEYFRMEFNDGSGVPLHTSVITVLDIKPDLKPDLSPNPTDYRMDYRFNEHIDSNIGNKIGGGIDTDHGHVAVSPDGTGTPDHHMIQGEKWLRFTGWGSQNHDVFYNYLACLSLHNMGDALREFVCCDVPEPATCERSSQPGQPVLIP